MFSLKGLIYYYYIELFFISICVGLFYFVVEFDYKLYIYIKVINIKMYLLSCMKLFMALFLF